MRAIADPVAGSGWRAPDSGSDSPPRAGAAAREALTHVGDVPGISRVSPEVRAGVGATSGPTSPRTDATWGASPGPYDRAVHHAIEVMERDERDGADPVDVARAVARVLNAEHPRRRASVGKAGERVGLVAKRALPHRWFEAVAKGSLGVE
jgi:hypothetical protein